MDYLVSCIAGLEHLVAELVQRDLEHTSLTRVEAGLVSISGRFPPGSLASLSYVNNSFAVLRSFDHGNIDSVLRQLVRDRTWVALARRALGKARRFRLMLSNENHLVGGDPHARGEVIGAIETNCSVSYAPRGGGAEFWLLRRRSGSVHFCIRVSRRTATEKTLAQGELRPELAELLCELSEPTADDVFLDPFAGSGAIVFARTRRPYNLAFAFDQDVDKSRAIRQRVKELKRKGMLRGGPIVARSEDARAMASFEDGFVHRVVTDPPWGHFSNETWDLRSLYKAIMGEFTRVTRVGGIVVLLLGRTEEAEHVVAAAHRGLDFDSRVDILVSGKKAIIARWRRQA